MRFYWRNRALLDKPQNEQLSKEIFRAKSCPIHEDEINSGRSTPNGIYAGSVGSDNVFRSAEEQAAWYKRPKWARWNPEEPEDINEDQFYTALSPQPSIAGGSAVVPVKGATFFHTCLDNYEAPIQVFFVEDDLTLVTFKVALILNQAVFHIVFVRKCVSRSNLECCKFIKKALCFWI